MPSPTTGKQQGRGLNPGLLAPEPVLAPLHHPAWARWYSQCADLPGACGLQCTLAWTLLTVDRTPATIYSAHSDSFTPPLALSNPSGVVASFLLWRPGNLGRKGPGEGVSARQLSERILPTSITTVFVFQMKYRPGVGSVLSSLGELQGDHCG